MKKILKLIVILLALVGLVVIIFLASTYLITRKEIKKGVSDAELRSQAQTVTSSARKFFFQNHRFPINVEELINDGYLDDSYHSLRSSVEYSLTTSEKGEDCNVSVELNDGVMFKETCREGVGGL